MATYKVLTGVDLPDKRVEAGDTVSESDIPKRSLKWLVDQSIIEVVEGSASTKSTKSTKAAKAAPAPEPEPEPEPVEDSGDDL